MSYILEALKKSQQERELGRVPTLDATGMFEEDKVVPHRSHWPLLAVALAAVAMVVALYAALKGPVATPPPVSETLGLSVPAVVDPRADPAPIRSKDVEVGRAVPPGGVKPGSTYPEDPQVAAANPASRSSWSPPAPASAPKGPVTGASRPLEPLIEPPPPKQGGRVRFPDPGEAPSFGGGSQVDDSPLPGDADLDEELELQRQMEADSVEPLDEEEHYVDPAPTPVPRDLIADIEAFKREVQGGQVAQKAPAKAMVRPIDKDPEKLRLTAAQEADLPRYLMTAHVYDADQSRRFVLINGLKYREGEKTREGITVERILAQGAVLSHKGNPFFVPR